MVRSVTPERLADMQDGDESFVLVDTRDPESYDSWHVAEAENFPYDGEESIDDRIEEFEALVDGEDRILTICAKGISSGAFVEELASHGYEDVAVVEGGMEAWSRVYEAVTIETDRERLAIVQVQRRAKGCLGYVVADTENGVAAVIDPSRHVEEFAAVADDRGWEVAAVLDTHVHADHVSGGRDFAAWRDVPYYLGERAAERGVEYRFEALGRNEILEVGDVDVKAVPTPGHTTEGVSYLIDDAAILTGDTLFMNAVGRTELEFGDEDAATGARMLYDSLHRTLMSLPDGTQVLPGHAAVTDEGEYEDGHPGHPIGTTIGAVRRGLDVLSLDRDAFVRRFESNVPAKPPNYETVIAINRGQRDRPDVAETTELELGPNRCAAE
ncbi:MAG: glyoxylase-like metal-dependent hydrolase (beta-lactamase superfamily II) [Halobacteriales archaeon]|jgi:glyoxylase-like metal-dependent hydrolase (beta-lactamase superfamily II)/rhodanese-related sulfurtransferase